MTRTAALPSVLAEYIAAINAFDEDAIVATFARRPAQRRAPGEFWGTEASAAGWPGNWSVTG